MKPTKSLALLLLALIITLASACISQPAPISTPTQTTTPQIIVDQLGREVHIEKIPQRIISLAPSNTEILFALGLGDKVVGVTKFCNYPPEAKEKPKVGEFAPQTINMEKIIALEPDLIFATGGIQKPLIPKLEEKGLKVVVLDPKNLAEVIEAINLVGKICGKEAQAAKIAEDMENRIKAIADKTNKLSQKERPRVLYILFAAPGQPLWTAGRGTFEDEIIGKAGGVNIAEELEGYKTLDLEKVITRDPEVIVTCAGHGEAKEATYNWVKTEPRLKDVSARKEGRIYQIDADLINRPGPRIVEALEKFAEFIHPELFKE